MQFLTESLQELESRIEERGGKLWCIAGKSIEVIPKLAEALSCSRVLAMRWTEPIGRKRDAIVKARLHCPLELVDGETLHAPGSLRSKTGTPYRVFTPFNRAFRSQLSLSAVHKAPSRLRPWAGLPSGFQAKPAPSIQDLGIPRNPRLLAGGESRAQERLRSFIHGPAASYSTLRDRMDEAGTSRLSADLKFGLLAPSTVWRAAEASRLPEAEIRKFTDELIWREFNYSTLWDSPEVLKKPFRAHWESFPWRRDKRLFEAWASGHTGFPIVDAACRELLATGYVHNRARMIAACFLTKHLLLDYRLGEAHYLKWLTDGDWAQNNMGWQWAAGCGADAQPWFRVFNPMTQGRKFDPTGAYVRQWVPELRDLNTRYLHAPWEAPPMELQFAGIQLGVDYPHPIVDHSRARQEFLDVAKAHNQRA